MANSINIVWLRRDLRLEDNTALSKALEEEFPVLLLFIFDDSILAELPANDARVSFIYRCLAKMNNQLSKHGGGIFIRQGTPENIFKQLINDYNVETVFTNKDYEPYARKRDETIANYLHLNRVGFRSFKDHVIFEENEIVKDNQTPYAVYTPYSKKWKANLTASHLAEAHVDLSTNKVMMPEKSFPPLEGLGFVRSEIQVPGTNFSELSNYATHRNLPAKNSTSKLSTHLRFGSVSIRQNVKKAMKTNEVFLNELIWREFFLQIMWHYPYVATHNFKRKYDFIQWRNDPEEFEKWCNGQTGYPIVDAGMRELNATGLMHNRVRMITASFLCKHLLIDWRWGEAYFAEKLLDYDLAINNGNWQWVAGSGCDAAPYFRVFNPTTQMERFDPQLEYTKNWVPELDTDAYPSPMIEHKFARQRALDTYKFGLAQH
jgi:deoxyribodipyrimidine photo-lyase